jgi:3-hydroxyisobutyrate dehydrogenase-like beta-hydroxyacid dehydrogenase
MTHDLQGFVVRRVGVVGPGHMGHAVAVKIYGGKIVEGRFSPPGGSVTLVTKDLRLALAEAERAAVPMPAASLVHDRLVAVAARGWSGLDVSALGLLAAVDAGLNDGR